MDRKRNGLVILALLLIIAIITGISLVWPKERRNSAITVTDPGGQTTDLLPDDPEVDEDDRVEFAELEPGEPRAWLLITVDDKVYPPYPLIRSGHYTVSQKKKNAVNVIYVTEDSMRMTSSSCDDQLCVREDAVTLDNKAGRSEGSRIVCQPNGVTLELLDAEEYAEWAAGQ